ncbi:MAG: peroxidase family protein, partial [Mycobacterium sp.]
MGRVGALAVALGIGGALAAAAPAWADESQDSSPAAGRNAATHRTDRSAAARPPARAARSAAGAATSVAASAKAQPIVATQPKPPQPLSATQPKPPPPPIAAPAKPPRQGLTYRSIDGSGNNLLNTDLNATGVDFRRIGPAHFSDGVSALRTDLPNTRTVSNLVVAGNAETPNAEGLSGMMYAWGQFIDHDINLTLSDNVNHIDIAVPAGDSTLSGSISMTRSVIDPLTGVAGKPASTTNNVTGWIDGSMVYGSDATTATSLRGTGGHLLTSAGNNLPIVDGAYLAGDIRVQETPDLTALQTVFVREHNRQVDKLALAHP